jgi:hypothetical protein
MKRFLPLVLIVAGFLVLVLLGLLFKAVLGRYILVFLLGFFGLSFIVTLVAFILVILNVPMGTSQKG